MEPSCDISSVHEWNQTMMKSVLFYSNHLRGPAGAAGARSWHQVKCLSERFKVTVVIPAVDPVTAETVQPESYAGLDERQVDVRLVSVASNDRTSVLRRARYFLSAMTSQFAIGLRVTRPNAMVSMSLPVTTLAVATAVSVLRHVPLVVDVRDLPFETAAEVGYLKQRWLVWILVHLETLLLRRARVVLTNSPHYKQLLIDRGIDEHRLHVAPIGYDDFGPIPERLVQQWRERLQSAFGDEPPSFIAIYAGTIGHAFPVGKLLDVAQNLSPGCSVGIALLGDGQRLSEYELRASREDLPVRFLGRVSKLDVHAACRAASACLYPAGDGVYSSAILGNKIFDYLGAERPIVYVGNRGAVSEVMERLGAGVVCSPDSPEDAARVLERMCDDSEWRDAFARRAAGYRSAGLTARTSAEMLRTFVDAVAR